MDRVKYIQSFWDHHTSKMIMIKNWSFLEHHSIQKWKLFQISPLMTAPLSQTRNGKWLVLSRVPQSYKVEITQYHSFQDNHSFVKWKLSKIGK